MPRPHIDDICLGLPMTSPVAPPIVPPARRPWRSLVDAFNERSRHRQAMPLDSRRDWDDEWQTLLERPCHTPETRRRRAAALVALRREFLDAGARGLRALIDTGQTTVDVDGVAVTSIATEQVASYIDRIHAYETVARLGAAPCAVPLMALMHADLRHAVVEARPRALSPDAVVLVALPTLRDAPPLRCRRQTATSRIYFVGDAQDVLPRDGTGRCVRGEIVLEDGIASDTRRATLASALTRRIALAAKALDKRGKKKLSSAGGRRIARILHAHGVPCRALGRVRAQARTAPVRACLLAEMVARAVKRIFRCRAERDGQHPVQLCRDLVRPSTADAWTAAIAGVLVDKFGTDDDRAPIAGLLQGCALLGRVLGDLGIQLANPGTALADLRSALVANADTAALLHPTGRVVVRRVEGLPQVEPDLRCLIGRLRQWHDAVIVSRSCADVANADVLAQIVDAYADLSSEAPSAAFAGLVRAVDDLRQLDRNDDRVAEAMQAAALALSAGGHHEQAFAAIAGIPRPSPVTVARLEQRRGAYHERLHALAPLADALGDDDDPTSARIDLVDANLAMGYLDDANAVLDSAALVAGVRKALGRKHLPRYLLQVGRAIRQAAGHLSATGDDNDDDDDDDAVACLTQAVAVADAVLSGSDRTLVVDCLVELADAHLCRQEAPAAVRSLKRAVAEIDAIHGCNSRDLQVGATSDTSSRSLTRRARCHRSPT